ncbi:MFS transporter [Antricoccus suffuscus]|nr:MFS transporter [Antricoccus suffuscus]
MAVLASLICSYEAAIAPAVPLLLPDLHMDLVTYGLITASALVVGALAGMVAGPLSDKLGRVRILIPLMGLTSILAFTMTLVDTPTHLVIVRCVLALVEGMAITTTAPLVRDYSPRMGRAQAFGFWAWGPVGANFISAGIASLTLPMFNNAWQSQFIIIGTLSLIASVVIALNIADLSPRLRAEVLETEKVVIENAEGAPPAKFSTLLTNPMVWAHVIGISAFLLLYLTVTGFGQLIITTTFHKSAAEASFIMAMFWVLNLTTLFLAGRWSDTLQLRRIFSLVFSVLSLVVMIYFATLLGDPNTSTVTLAITGAILGGAMGAAYSPWMANYSENSEDLDPRLQGLTWGIFYLVVRLASVALTIIAPIIVKQTGSWQTWIIVCVVGVAVFIVLMPFYKGPWTRAQLAATQAPVGDISSREDPVVTKR